MNILQDLGNNTYSVPSEAGNGSYVIDAELQRCECPVGNSGDICKHQVWLAIKLDLPPIVARTIDVRKKLYTVATGSTLHVKHLLHENLS